MARVLRWGGTNWHQNLLTSSVLLTQQKTYLGHVTITDVSSSSSPSPRAGQWSWCVWWPPSPSPPPGPAASGLGTSGELRCPGNAGQDPGHLAINIVTIITIIIISLPRYTEQWSRSWLPAFRNTSRGPDYHHHDYVIIIEMSSSPEMTATVSSMMRLMGNWSLGSVLAWHSYSPASASLSIPILSSQIPERG